MKHYLTRHLLSVNEQIQLDPTLIMCMQKLFDWANEMGRQGIKVSHLTVVPPRTDSCISQPCTIWCKQECTEEEEKQARAHREEMIKQAALCGWSTGEEDAEKEEG